MDFSTFTDGTLSPLTSTELIAVRQMVLKTFPEICITDTKKIKNDFLAWYYEMKKEENKVRFGTVKEYLLFHVTSALSVSSIIKDNFDWRRITRGLFGRGTSFSNNASYANKYANFDIGKNRALIITKVLVSKPIQGNRNMIVPPKEFDTTVGNNSVFVKFNDNEMLPQFVVFYEFDNNLRQRSRVTELAIIKKLKDLGLYNNAQTKNGSGSSQLEEYEDGEEEYYVDDEDYGEEEGEYCEEGEYDEECYEEYNEYFGEECSNEEDEDADEHSEEDEHQEYSEEECSAEEGEYDGEYCEEGDTHKEEYYGEEDEQDSHGEEYCEEEEDFYEEEYCEEEDSHEGEYCEEEECNGDEGEEEEDGDEEEYYCESEDGDEEEYYNEYSEEEEEYYKEY